MLGTIPGISLISFFTLTKGACMLKKVLTTALVAVSLTLLASCAATLPVNATSNPVGSKVGEASGTQFAIWFVDGGDLSISKAAKNGGIKEISTVDFKTDYSLAIIGVTRYTTIVTGE